MIFTSQMNAKYNKCYRNLEERSLWAERYNPEIDQAEWKN